MKIYPLYSQCRIFKKVSLIILILLAPLTSVSYAKPININEANVAEITENLTNVGAVKAIAIIEYREAHGPFKSVDDLIVVKGIGEKTIEQNRDNLLLETAIELE